MSLPLALVALAIPAAAFPSQPTWTAFSSGPNATVNTMVVGNFGAGPRLALGGEFTIGSGVPSAHIASWNGVTFDSIPSLNAEVLGLTIYPFAGQPHLCAGGFVGLIGNQPIGGDGTNIVHLTPSGWQAVTPFTQLPWVGGLATYTPVGGPPRLVASGGGMNYIAQFNGSVWSDMGAGLITVSDSMLAATYNGQPVLFATAGTPAQTTLGMGATWDGTQWTNYATFANGINGIVNAIAIFDDGSGPTLFIGGTFGGFTAAPLSRVAKLVGNTWQNVGGGVSGAPNTTTVNAMTVFDDGDGFGPTLFIAGEFTTASGQPANRIAKLRNGQWVPLGAGITGGSIFALAVFDDDGAGPIPPALYAAGTFTTAGGEPTMRWARWGPPAPCTADIARLGGTPGADGQISVDDLVYYLQSFFGANLPVADIARLGGAAGPDGQLTVDDLVAYLAAFFAGCS